MANITISGKLFDMTSSPDITNINAPMSRTEGSTVSITLTPNTLYKRPLAISVEPRNIRYNYNRTTGLVTLYDIYSDSDEIVVTARGVFDNFQFLKNRIQLRINRGGPGTFRFYAYLYLNNGNLVVVRNNNVNLNTFFEGDQPTNVRYFECVWDDRLNAEWDNHLITSQVGLTPYNKAPDHGWVPDSELLAAGHSHKCMCITCRATRTWCQCESCETTLNGIFYMNSETNIKCVTAIPGSSECQCKERVCFSFDGGLEFMRIIGLKGLNFWYVYHYDNYDIQQQELTHLPEDDPAYITSEEYEERMKAYHLLLSGECNSIIDSLEKNIKRDWLSFIDTDEGSLVTAMNDSVDLHNSGEYVTIMGDYGRSETNYIFYKHNQTPPYRIEGKVKDSYESFIYEWRQAIVKFRNNHGLDYEGYTV